MCHFITAILPADADAERIATLAQRHGRAWRSLSGRGVASWLRPGETYWLTTPGHCDCGTALGQLPRMRSRSQHEGTETARLRRRGWGETKIARWREQRDDRAAKKEAGMKARMQDDLTRWRRFLSEVLEHRYSAYVAVLVHMYDGRLDDDLALEGRDIMPIEQLDDTLLSHLQEDRIHEFHAHP